MIASEIVDRIVGRHARDRGWLVLREVQPPALGKDLSRRYDAVAVSLWGSMGSVVHGFEVKVARSDWRAELLNPAKSAALAKHCDYWWVVAPKDVVIAAEAPPGWGVLHANGAGLRVVRQATRLQPTREEGFWQFLLSRAVSRTDVDEAAQLRLVAAQFAKDRERSTEVVQSREARALTLLRAQVDAFEKASGIRIEAYEGSGEKAATLARLHAQGTHKHALRNVASAQALLLKSLETVEALAAHLASLED